MLHYRSLDNRSNRDDPSDPDHLLGSYSESSSSSASSFSRSSSPFNTKALCSTSRCFLTLLITQAITLILLLTRSLPAGSPLPSNALNLEKEMGDPFPGTTNGMILAAMNGHKINIPHVTPRENQEHRGTCWDFATIGILEWSYRAHGIKMGWLKPEEYVAFNEQAYGAIVIDKCNNHPDKCLIPEDEIWLGSTEGGEIPILWALPGMGNMIVPRSVCPYIPDQGKDHVCPGLKEALDANPINFELKGMTTLYEVEAIKKHLRTHGKVLGFSSAMTNAVYFKPCLGKVAKDNKEACERDAEGQCKQMCPIDRFPPGTCCVFISYPNYNREGEFYYRGPTDYMEGGHAMQIVGYNDNFVTVDGSEGGFILKNNWLTNASHSIAYFMQDISRWDENTMCPNSANPRNWYTCDTLPQCLSEQAKLYAQVTAQPKDLKCINPTFCTVSPDITYFIKNYSVVGDNMHRICMFRYNNTLTHGNGLEICLDPLVLDMLARYFTPRDFVANDPDHCGYFFWPYDMVKKVWSRFHNSYATDFDIEWLESSYLANAHKYPHLNYSHIQRSTYTQTIKSFEGPIPYEHLSMPSRHEIQIAKKQHKKNIEELKKHQVPTPKPKDNP